MPWPAALSVIMCIRPWLSRYIACRSSTSRISSARTAVVARTAAKPAAARTILESDMSFLPLGFVAAVQLEQRGEDHKPRAITEMPSFYRVDSAALWPDVRTRRPDDTSSRGFGQA